MNRDGSRTATPLPHSFYDRPAQDVARDLLGRMLWRQSEEGLCGGRIVEVEAYLRANDPGSHAASRRTPRNEPMFGPPGHAYVYRVHRVFCLNLVTAPRGAPEAVLVRALEPTEGLEAMRRRRSVQKLKDLCSGPGKLCQAFDIDLALNRHDLTTLPLYLTEGELVAEEIVVTTRIGLRDDKGADLPLRYYLKGTPFVSRK